MIITRTPFRISFFGGGTDYPVWFQDHEGAVLATTINKHCYLTVRYMPPFFDYKSRVVWSKIELVKENEEIDHPAVNAVLRYLKENRGISIHHEADLPARTGLGSSSTFTVGLLHALYGLRGVITDKESLAKEAIHVEQKVLAEHVGCQDQITATYGGFNRIHFQGENQFHVTPITVPEERLESLQNHLLLFYTGISRTASEIAKKQIEVTKKKKKDLKVMYQMVSEGIRILGGQGPLTEFGRLLHESWKIKRNLTDKISNGEIDEAYNVARRAGGVGGKILGAGGGGFLLIFARPEDQPKIKEQLANLLYVPFRFSHLGSQIIYYESRGA